MTVQEFKELQEAIKAEREASDAYVRLLEADIAELRAAVAAAVEAERERCAKIVDDHKRRSGSKYASEWLDPVAAAIRAQVTP